MKHILEEFDILENMFVLSLKMPHKCYYLRVTSGSIEASSILEGEYNTLQYKITIR